MRKKCAVNAESNTGGTMIQELSVIAMLGICSLEDVKNRKIHILWPVLFTIEGVLFWIFWRQQPIIKLLPAVIPGAAMLVLALLMRQGIGEGDGILLMVMGIYLGAARAFWVFIYALFLSAGYALYLYIIRRKSKTYEIAFVPFMLISFVVELILRK